AGSDRDDRRFAGPGRAGADARRHPFDLVQPGGKAAAGGPRLAHGGKVDRGSAHDSSARIDLKAATGGIDPRAGIGLAKRPPMKAVPPKHRAAKRASGSLPSSVWRTVQDDFGIRRMRE